MYVDLQPVARLVRVIGKKQGIVAKCLDPFSFEQIAIKTGDFLFINIDELPVPFQVQAVERKTDASAILYFDFSLDDAITPQDLLGAELLFEKASLINIDTSLTHNLDSFCGSVVYDQHDNLIGEITGYEQYSFNRLLVVQRPDGTECLIPFHENLLLTTNKPTENTLHLTIADGLLDS